jgi:hypothetical protein
MTDPGDEDEEFEEEIDQETLVKISKLTDVITDVQAKLEEIKGNYGEIVDYLESALGNLDDALAGLRSIR